MTLGVGAVYIISFAIFMGVSVFGRVFTPSLSTPQVIFFAVTQIVRAWSYVTTSATRRSNRSMKMLSFVSLHVGSVRNVQTIFGCIS